LIVHSTKKETDNRWLNLFTSEYTRGEKSGRWTFASRSRNADGSPTGKPDAVIIVPLVVAGINDYNGTQSEDRLCMIKEYRIPIQDYEYHFPAGLIDAGEAVEMTAVRELKEETGLEIARIKKISPMLYSSTGCTDESAVMVFVDAIYKGKPQSLEANEEIEVLYLKRHEVQAVMNDPTKRMSAKTWPLLMAYDLLGGFF
jgi:ADP-ribose pyrophosphatase